MRHLVHSLYTQTKPQLQLQLQPQRPLSMVQMRRPARHPAVVADALLGDASLSGTVRGADPGQHVSPEEPDREHHQHERDDQVHEGGKHIADLQCDATDRHRDSRQTLAC